MKWRFDLTFLVILMVAATSPCGAIKSATAGERAGHGATIGTFGFDIEGMDKSVAPGDDFTRYAVGRWIDATKIPEDRSNWGSVGAIKQATATQVRDIVETAARADAPRSDEARKIGDYLNSFMDEARIERLGISPLRPELDAIAAIDTRKVLSAILGAQVRTDVDVLNLGEFHTPHLIALWVAEDLDDAKQYRPYLLQGGLGMPDREYYIGSGTRYAELRVAYTTSRRSCIRCQGGKSGCAIERWWRSRSPRRGFSRMRSMPSSA